MRVSSVVLRLVKQHHTFTLCFNNPPKQAFVETEEIRLSLKRLLWRLRFYWFKLFSLLLILRRPVIHSSTKHLCNQNNFFAALGTTPSHLHEIINADVGFGRYQRQAPVPRRRLSRSPSPSFHLGSSRGTTPDFNKVQRLASPDGKVVLSDLVLNSQTPIVGDLAHEQDLYSWDTLLEEINAS